MSKKLVVIGSTGKQGGAVLNALHQSSASNDYSILAVHRKPEAASTLRNKYSSVKPVQGDIDNAAAIFKAVGSAPDALYFMTPNGKKEVEQGKAVISAAVKAGTKHIVFSSVDRGAGGNVRSGVDHWDTKHEIEAFLRSQNNITYTIIRPSAFLENFVPGFNGKVFATVWRNYLGDRKMKLVSTSDIGAVAARAMIEPEQYRNAEINLAGDDLTFEEASLSFQKLTGGKTLPTTNGFLVWILVALIKDLKQMAAFLKEKGYGAEVQRDLMDWETWVRQSVHAADRKS